MIFSSQEVVLLLCLLEFNLVSLVVLLGFSFLESELRVLLSLIKGVIAIDSIKIFLGFLPFSEEGIFKFTLVGPFGDIALLEEVVLVSPDFSSLKPDSIFNLSLLLLHVSLFILELVSHSGLG